MICTGKLTRTEIDTEVTMVNSEGLVIYSGYRHYYAPEKIIIHGCNGKYHYLGELANRNGCDVFTIYEHDTAIVEIKRLPSLIIPKCKIKHSDRKFAVKFSVKNRKATMRLLDKGECVASMSFVKNNYEIIINDNENPTLLVTMLIGISEVNKLADRALAKV